MLNLTRINPIVKICFVLFELIFLFSAQNTVLNLSILVVLMLIFLFRIDLLKHFFSAILNLSPLFFGIIFLGYLLGTDWRMDFILVEKIIILISFTTILLHTTSSTELLQNVRSIFRRKNFDNFNIFIFGLINFFPILRLQFSEISAKYKSQNVGRIRLFRFPQIFINTIEKSLSEVHTMNNKVDEFLKNDFKFSFSISDFLVIIILVFQLLLVIL